MDNFLEFLMFFSPKKHYNILINHYHLSLKKKKKQTPGRPTLFLNYNLQGNCFGPALVNTLSLYARWTKEVHILHGIFQFYPFCCSLRITFSKKNQGMSLTLIFFS